MAKTLEQPLSHLREIARLRIGEKDTEHIAAHAAQKGVRREKFGQPLRNPTQKIIADFHANGFVNEGHFVDAEHHIGAKAFAYFCGMQNLIDLLCHMVAIKTAGQRVTSVPFMQSYSSRLILKQAQKAVLPNEVMAIENGDAVFMHRDQPPIRPAYAEFAVDRPLFGPKYQMAIIVGYGTVKIL
jgi:hypothetical protein